MTSDRAEIIFLEALEYRTLEERDRYILISCEHDQLLLEEVRTMLRDLVEADDLFNRTSNYLELPADLQNVKANFPLEELQPGEQIGAYTLIKKLGEGACGVVFEARQKEPIKRDVAIKILKLGMDSQEIIRRFEAEFQILAHMDHSHIASIYDAGITPSGRPFFVMELVQGTSITQYCNSRKHGLQNRLELIRQVCSAVQHAHDRGVIHRDIKPSNILVSEVDGAPLLKIIDFGIAKVLDSRMSSKLALTFKDEIVGTPSYMAPEQVCGVSSVIDVRSDVYSIGALLYELLTGVPPFDNKELLQAGMDTMRNRIQEEVPPSPSILVDESSKGYAIKISKDLDWIVLKAMAKEPCFRYRSAIELGDDLKRFLDGRSIEAHPPSLLYGYKKWISRNKLVFASFSFAWLSLLVGFSASTFLYVRAKDAEHKQLVLRMKAEERAHVARAAILIEQKKYPEANAEIEKMTTPPSEPSLEATNVFKTLKIWSGMNGDWETSSKRVMELSKVYRFDVNDNSDNVTRDLVSITPTLIKSKHLDAYRSFCDDLLNQFGTTKNPVAAEQLLKICTFMPVSKEMISKLKPVVEVAEYSMLKTDEQPNDWLEAWRCAVIGNWYYRVGDYAKAQYWSERTLLFQDEVLSRIAYAKCIQSMSLSKLNKPELADEALEEAKALVYSHIKIPFEYNNEGIWFEWLYAELLLDEAIQNES